MDTEIRTWLFDILNAIEEISSFFADKPRIFTEYKSDIKTKRAVERNIEIIGEAVNRILNKDEDFNISNASKIIATRNRIIHGYDMVSDDIIWSIIINHLPELEAEINTLFK